MPLLFFRCKKEVVVPQFNYNQRANELIRQIVLEESCGCLSEMNKGSMVKTLSNDQPNIDFRKQIIGKLYLRDSIELDSLDNLTKDFSLDTTFLKQQKIKLITDKSFRKLLKEGNLLALCPDGVLSISKPLFNKRYNRVIVNSGYGFACIPSPMAIYEFENGKWERQIP